MDKAKQPSLLNLVWIVIVAIVVLVYLFVTLSTEDPIWFVSTFAETPDEIYLNCYGTEYTFIPGNEEFDGIVAIVNETLSGNKNYDSLTMSEQTYLDYHATDIMMVMELYYSPPVRIHSFYKYFSNLDSILIPLDGRHAPTFAIFGRANDLSTAGSLHYAEIPNIRAYLESNGICTAP